MISLLECINSRPAHFQATLGKFIFNLNSQKVNI